ncbi:hypothetical protein JKA74_11050 [Marivirga sp. S37H4]|uniref:Glyceraldehyde 3-phosphate dehydrogenase NAD(P) binding domain-containing protein n=1 Tax=Marivirga aurantiaca TaxID=2802615 RepID=A0A934WZA9_9BACT|nr:glyceraldehyde 3-phosphate dehydrogenase NAD-binding domain-containing protein [Marivirga aurantiaca]MBK6265575.1 hypothetical protein [Marivirga aurantiaca]
MKNVAINGLGRTGRAALKIILANDDLNLVAVNDADPPDDLEFLLKYDTPSGRHHTNVQLKNNKLHIDGKEYLVFNEKNPEDLPWKELEIDLVFDCSEVFSLRKNIQKHCKAGAKKAMSWYDNEWGYISQIVSKAKNVLGQTAV